MRVVRHGGLNASQLFGGLTDGVIRVGISGWTYEAWRGVFYPPGLDRADELGFAARQFRTIEISSTFYATHRPNEFANWTDQVPADRVFAVKGSRSVTHILRLREPLIALADFVASGVLRLGTHLGPIVWQLPANLPFDESRMAFFLGLLPRDTVAAAALGQTYARCVCAPTTLAVAFNRPIRHAIEVRHHSFRCQAFIDLLRDYGVALVSGDSLIGPRVADLTADFVYCRLLGPDPLSPACYDTAALAAWAQRAKLWAAGQEPDDLDRIGGKARTCARDVFMILDNQRRIRDPANALELMRQLPF